VARSPDLATELTASLPPSSAAGDLRSSPQRRPLGCSRAHGRRPGSRADPIELTAGSEDRRRTVAKLDREVVCYRSLRSVRPFLMNERGQQRVCYLPAPKKLDLVFF